MDIITRKIINPKTFFHKKIYDGKFADEHVEYTEFCQMIDRWKMFFVENYTPIPGQTVFIDVSLNIPFYYALVFAVAELGLILIVDWVHCYSADDLDSTRTKIYGKIDFIVQESYPVSPRLTTYQNLRNIKYCNNLINLEDFKNYQIKNHDQFQTIKNVILCNPNTVFVITTSSGTTGEPKVVKETHKKIMDMSRYVGVNLKFGPDEKIAHLKSLHHGSSMCLFFLPSLFNCWQHYFYAIESHDKYDEKFINFLLTEKINRLFLYSPAMLTGVLQEMPRIDHPLKILTLNYITPTVVEMVKEKNINMITSSFGDATIGSAFFLKTVTPETDLASYDVSNMGKPLGDFYEFDLRDSRLYVKSDLLNLDWCTSNDIFTITDDGDYCFHGRADEYRVNSEWISFADIDNIVRKVVVSNNAVVVPDLEMQQLYLVVWDLDNYDETVKQLNNIFQEKFKHIKINFVYKINYVEFYSGRKLDFSKIRAKVRKIFKEKEIL